MYEVLYFGEDSVFVDYAPRLNLTIHPYISNYQDNFYDILIMDIDFVDTFDVVVTAQANNNIISICLVDSLEQLAHCKKLGFDAWILKPHYESLNNIIIKFEKTIKINFKHYKNLQNIIENNIFNEVNLISLDMIKKHINKATTSIEENFEHNIQLLKDTIGTTRNAKTKETLTVVLESLHRYISILQFEDEVFQMMDGIKNIISQSMQNANTMDLVINEEKWLDFRKSLASYYTIQDQRDVVLGIETKEVEDGELTFF